MELVCNKCGYKKDLGKAADLQGTRFKCLECRSDDVKLIDSGGGVNIKVDGITEDTIVNIIKELAKNVSVYDIFGFLAKQGQVKEKDKDEGA